ncbi:hypothetical protein LCGC14_0509720 [marine sediment metagenome]|uniref:Uncharacterized protein n=1 Tax=marine sediment metagenome TaxID=412755 RepID=A0A0F9UNC9_9ZZZZ
MRTIIIPERIIDVPNWVYWLHSNPVFLVLLGAIGFVLLYFLYFFLMDRYHGWP